MLTWHFIVLLAYVLLLYLSGRYLQHLGFKIEQEEKAIDGERNFIQRFILISLQTYS